MAFTYWDIKFLRLFVAARDDYSNELQNRVDTAHLRDVDQPLRAHEHALKDQRIFNEFIVTLTFFKERASSLSGLDEVFDQKARVPGYYRLRRHPWEAYFLYVEPVASRKQPPKLYGVLFCHEWDRPVSLQKALTEAQALG